MVIFSQIFYQFDLYVGRFIRGSTYTRVYTVLCNMLINFSHRYLCKLLKSLPWLTNKNPWQKIIKLLKHGKKWKQFFSHVLLGLIRQLFDNEVTLQHMQGCIFWPQGGGKRHFLEFGEENRPLETKKKLRIEKKLKNFIEVFQFLI